MLSNCMQLSFANERRIHVCTQKLRKHECSYNYQCLVNVVSMATRQFKTVRLDEYGKRHSWHVCTVVGRQIARVWRLYHCATVGADGGALRQVRNITVRHQGRHQPHEERRQQSAAEERRQILHPSGSVASLKSSTTQKCWWNMLEFNKLLHLMFYCYDIILNHAWSSFTKEQTGVTRRQM